MGEDIYIKGCLLDKLFASIRKGPLLEDGRYSLNEVRLNTIQDCLGVYINTNDHPPPHIHIQYQRQQILKFNISDGECMNNKQEQNRVAKSFFSKYKNNIRKWILENQNELSEKWNKIVVANN